MTTERRQNTVMDKIRYWKIGKYSMELKFIESVESSKGFSAKNVLKAVSWQYQHSGQFLISFLTDRKIMYFYKWIVTCGDFVLR